MSIFDYKPYTFHRSSWIFNTYQIAFDETPIREVIGRGNAKSITFLLNAAWQLGYASGEINGQLSCQKH